MKRHENIVAALYKPLTPAERAILRMRGNRRRSSVERSGLIRVHFVKLLNPPAHARTAQPEPPPPPHDDDCRCHLCWAASLDMPSPPWEAPEPDEFAMKPPEDSGGYLLPGETRPEGIEQWEWELGKTDPEQHICGYCGAPYYPGDTVYCASCAPREGGVA